MNIEEANKILEKEKTIITADIIGRKSRKYGEFFLTEKNVIYFFGKFKWFGLKVETYRNSCLILPLDYITHAAEAGGLGKGLITLPILQVYINKEGVGLVTQYLNSALEGKQITTAFYNLFGGTSAIKEKRVVRYSMNNPKSLISQETLKLNDLANKITELAEKNSGK